MKTRGAQEKKYMEFIQEYEGLLKPFPCDSNQVCLYVTHMMKSLQFVSIRNYLSGLNNLLQLEGYPPIQFNNYSVKRCINGAKRILGDNSKRAKPLLPRQLAAIMDQLTLATGHVCFRAALLCSFRGLLRKAHVTVSTATLHRKDFKFYKWGMVIHIAKSKTIQYAERTVEIPIARIATKEMCAVYWTERHFSEIPAEPHQEAFRLPTGKPMTYRIYQDTLKFSCEEIGLDPRLFSSHSLRRGGATFLLMSGATISEIRERGDWTSDCVYKYLEVPLEVRIREDMVMAMMFLEEAIKN